MIDIKKYINELILLLSQQFESRLLYVGLQGSYLRQEANDNSDIDIMIIIDNLCVADLIQYRSVIESIEHADKACGFICSKEDLANWNPLEICHLLHSTKDYYGHLVNFIPAYTDKDTRNFVKLSINNLYHELCHRYIHATPQDNACNLTNSYKSVFFILQNIFYLNNGYYIDTKAKLLSSLDGLNRDILKRSIELNSGIIHDFDESFELLFSWCQETLKTL